MRVQIPAYTDAWMRGDRYGEVVKTVKGRKSTLKVLGEEAWRREAVAHVRLDKSRRTVRVILDDCAIAD